MRSKILLLLLFSFLKTQAQFLSAPDTTIFNGLKYRCVGPSRGGRSAAVCGVDKDPLTYYFGSTGGGVWKTTDGGSSWKNISDGFFGGSIGSVTVAPSDDNIIYVGGGENTLRGNVSHGYGIWKSEDAGATWVFSGLPDAHHIPRIVVDEKNPDLAWAAVLGHTFGSNDERGIYRTQDGGKTWQRILFVSTDAGAVDIVQDPHIGRILYASTWRVRRTPYSMESGGEGSHLWKSTDYGATWVKISTNEGFPKGTLGIIGITVSPVKRDRLWAIVEAKDGGVFRSDDAGKTWSKTSSDANVRQRAWYFSKIFADTENPDGVYICNVEFLYSDDGGAKFKKISTPHGDHHSLWIAPTNSKRMIVADDGGAQITADAGKKWSSYHNQPTGQFYRVTTDNDFPYHALMAQQDNSTVRIKMFDGVSWESTAGFESGNVAAYPKDPDLVFGGNYDGFLGWYNHRTKESRTVTVYPNNPMGSGVEGMKQRFQWNFPFFFSSHEPHELYAGGNTLFKSTDFGQSWQSISPDLTRNDSTKMKSSGGEITKDNTSVEYYGTIFATAESPLVKGLIWTGSDDGLIHLTRNGGKTWDNVTPPAKLMPEWTMINCIEPHPSNPAACYIAATAYKNNDFKPYLFKTTDYGKTWTLIVKGIEKQHFTRCIRVDKKREGLLFAGTESGMYISFNDGDTWGAFQLNLPIVPITDMTIKDEDLLVATQGRALWVLDNIGCLRQSDANIKNKKIHVYTPRAAYRGVRSGDGNGVGSSPVGSAMIDFYLKDTIGGLDTLLKIKILDAKGEVVKQFLPNVSEEDKRKDRRLEAFSYHKGFNRIGWDGQYIGAEDFDGMVFWGGNLSSVTAPVGTYKAVVYLGKDSLTEKIILKQNPKSKNSENDIQQQFECLIACRNKLTDMHRAITSIRKIRKQVNEWKSRFDSKTQSALIKKAEELVKKATEIEESIYQTKSQSPQDPINYPIRLNNKLALLAGDVSEGDFPPTKQAIEVQQELFKAIDIELEKYKTLKETDIPAFNKAVLEAQVEAVKVD